MARARSTPVRDRRGSGALDGLVRDGDGVLLLGLEELGEEAREVLTASGLRLLRVAEADAAVRVVADAPPRSS